MPPLYPRLWRRYYIDQRLDWSMGRSNRYRPALHRSWVVGNLCYSAISDVAIGQARNNQSMTQLKLLRVGIPTLILTIQFAELIYTLANDIKNKW